eukprot:3589369-Rhodomonas_salina.1
MRNWVSARRMGRYGGWIQMVVVFVATKSCRRECCLLKGGEGDCAQLIVADVSFWEWKWFIYSRLYGADAGNLRSTEDCVFGCCVHILPRTLTACRAVADDCSCLLSSGSVDVPR